MEDSTKKHAGMPVLVAPEYAATSPETQSRRFSTHSRSEFGQRLSAIFRSNSTVERSPSVTSACLSQQFDKMDGDGRIEGMATLAKPEEPGTIVLVGINEYLYNSRNFPLRNFEEVLVEGDGEEMEIVLRNEAAGVYRTYKSTTQQLANPSTLVYSPAKHHSLDDIETQLLAIDKTIGEICDGWDRAIVCLRTVLAGVGSRVLLDQGTIPRHLLRTLTNLAEAFDKLQRDVVMIVNTCDSALEAARTWTSTPSSAQLIQTFEKTKRRIDRLQMTVDNELAGRVNTLIQRSSNVISIDEAYRFRELGLSMKRLSWVTFIFLPLLFVATLYGMNVDVLADNPPIWTYFAFAVGTFVLVMATVYLWKRRELCENFLIGSFLRNSNYRKLVVDDEELQLNSTPTPTRDTFEMAKQALYSSIEAGNEATFRTIIRKNKSLVNEPLGCSNSSLVRNADLQYGPSPLMLAAYYGRINIVRCLIELGANIDAVDRIERTANSYALFSRRLDVSILRVLNRKSSTSSGLSQYAPLLPMFLQMCQWDQDSSAKSTPEDVITFILSHPCFKGRITYQACKELDEHKSKVYCSLIDAFKSCYSLEIAASLLRIVALLATSKTHRYFESSISDGVRDKDLDIIRSFGINLCQSPVCEDLLQSMGCLDQDSSLKWYKELEALWDDILGKLGQRMKEHCQWKHIVLDGALRRLNKRVLHSGDPLECPTEDPLTPTGALDLVQTTMHVWNVGLSCYDEVFDAPRYSMPLIFALLEDFYDAPSYRGFNEWWAAAGSERTEAALALFDLFLDIGGTRSLELRLEMRSDSQRPRPWHSQYESGKTGKTPLIYAACHGLHQHALILLERGADINRGLSLQERLGLRWTGPARGRLMLLRIWRTYWLEGIVGHRR